MLVYKLKVAGATLVAALAAGAPVAVAHDGKHQPRTTARAAANVNDCHSIVDGDPWHPNAPDSMSSYHCHGLGGEWVSYHYRAKASGNYGQVGLRHWHTNWSGGRNCVVLCLENWVLTNHVHRSYPFH